MQSGNFETPSSFWAESIAEERTSYPKLDHEAEFDVAIIGAGITGLTTALMLKSNGLKVAVLEAYQVGHGTTGSTSAHLTTLWDGGLSTLISKYGDSSARLFYSGLAEAISTIEQLTSDHKIECDFSRVDGYLFCEPKQSSRALSDELEALDTLGVPIDSLEGAPLPFPTASAMRIPRQGQFHPLKYLEGLAKAVHSEGSCIFERSRVVDISDGNPCVLATSSGSVRSKYVIHATHSPLGINSLQTECTQYQSYVIAVRTSCKVESSLYWDVAEPYHYIRTYKSENHNGKQVVIIGGADHKTGKGNPHESIANLRTYATERFEDVEFLGRWSAQFFEPDDYLPFIGKSPLSERTFVATGFSGDGLTCGTLAARILTDAIIGNAHPLAELLAPSRLPTKGLSRFLRDNAEVAADYITGYLGSSKNVDPAKLKLGEGGVTRVGLTKVAYYRDEAGMLHKYSAICPHMKGVVSWNAFQKSFDCPCHGSRFGVDGQVLDGPSLKPLEKLNTTAESTAKQTP